MGQSLVQNYLHIVFSTKNRAALINDKIENDLHAYLGGICNQLDCRPIKIGGYTDHVHILCTLSKKIALVKLLEELKSHSSKWMKLKGEEFRNFYWQDACLPVRQGYGAFSVNPTEVGAVVNYIANQKEHHSKKTFQDEYRAFLKKYLVEYDERYGVGLIFRPCRAFKSPIHLHRAYTRCYYLAALSGLKKHFNFLSI